MRPLRLTFKGFTSFREKQEVDFSGLDLFAIAGPTGAGKSSILDAMTYALYGRVERVGDRVALLISQGLPQMAVELEFAIDAQRYRLTRRTQRPAGKQPALTKAILERLDGGEWADEAGQVREVEARVHELIGLDYDGFTRAVLLPQGKFDQFLTGDAPLRRRILSDLLGLELWERMGRFANTAAASAHKERELKEEFLRTDYAGVSEEAIAEQRRKARELRAHEKKLVAVRERVRQLERRRDEARRAAADVLACSGEAREIASTATAIAASMKDVARARTSAAEALAKAEKGGTAAVADAKRSAAAYEAAVEKWGTVREVLDLRGTAERYIEMRDEHSTLKKGDVCPTCGRVLAETPKPSAATAKKMHALEAVVRSSLGKLPRDPVAAFDERVATLEELERAAQRADDTATKRERARTEAQRILDQADARLGREHAKLPLSRLRALTTRATPLTPAAKLPRAPSRAPAVDALDELPTFASELAGMASAIADALDAVASPGDAEAACLAEAKKAVGDLVPPARDLDGIVASVDRAVREAAGDAKTAEARAADITERLERKVQLGAEVKALGEREKVMHALGLDLKQDAIVDFVQAEALHALAAEGSKRLKYLSSGRYGLRYRDDEFFVTDGNNGDEERSVRTLSGGESFLASLALALTLSEQVRALATTQHARLDSLFLDEGFGTLDPETLETVIDGIERLGVDGRLVGVISHVRELTDRFQRLEIEKSPRGSHVRVAS
ncbi:MAG: SMC family ATPase [Chloroflexota bacterium]|nr:SMC family ATPase [Chloroflexota bacterium]